MTRAGVHAPAASADAMYRGLGRGVFELLWLSGASEARRARVLAREVTLDARTLDLALDRGPVVLCASHTGNWELAAAAAARVLATRGRRLAVVAKPMSSPGIDAFCTRLRARLGVAVIAPAGALSAARAALAAGACVAMPIDQVPERSAHARAAEFLGAPALVDRAPGVLARRAGASLLAVAARRDRGRHRVEVLASWPPPRSAGEVDRALAGATAALADFVRRQPESWLWLHRRWRAPLDRLIDSAWTTRSSSPAAASRAA